jgi:hypothetical protein
MKKIALIMCILLLVWCGKKQTTVQTEGLEEVIVFGEEENVSTEPVLPATPTEEAVMPEVEPVLPPPLEEEIVSPPFEEEPIMPTEEIAIAPPVVEEEPLLPVLPVEETPPPVVRPVPRSRPAEHLHQCSVSGCRSLRHQRKTMRTESRLMPVPLSKTGSTLTILLPTIRYASATV